MKIYWVWKQDNEDNVCVGNKWGNIIINNEEYVN